MANRIRSRSFAVGRGVKRQTLWIGSTSPQTGETALAAGSAVLFARVSAAQVSDVAPLTWVRNRGLFSVRSDQQITSEEVHGAFGIAVVSEAAAAAGVGSIPTPITESDWDGWMVWQPFAHHMHVATAVGFSEPSAGRFDYDSKAMRKMADQESLVFVVENQNTNGGLFFTWLSRSLMKLH